MILSTDNSYSLTIKIGKNEHENDDSNFEPLAINCAESNLEYLTPQSLNSVEFRSSEHESELLLGLHLLRSKELLLDITLQAEDESFKAHRVVLSACSDYFRAMFTDPMRERTQSCIYLAGVTAHGMRCLLDYMYTGKIELHIANIQDILSAASHLQVVEIVDACSGYLQTQIEVENCVDIVTIAETYYLRKLCRKVYRFMCEYLSAFSTHSVFQRMSLTQLENLLDSGFPVDVSEDRMLDIVLAWLNNEQRSRLGYAHGLLKRINMAEVSPHHLSHVLSLKLNCYIQRILSLVPTVIISSTDSILSSPRLVNSRGMQEVILKVGGFGIRGITNHISFRSSFDHNWFYLTSIPSHVDCCNFGICTQNNRLYVVGGCYNQALQEQIHPFGFSYDPRFDKWTSIPPMLKERCRFSLTNVAEYIYAVGGSSDDETAGYTCELYNPETNSWCWVPSIPPGYSRSQHSACEWPGGRLLVSGGIDAHEFVLDSMILFDPKSATWSVLRSMLVPRADHVLLPDPGGERVLVAGGWFEDEVSGNRTLVDTLDVYDIATDTWRIETRIPTPRYHAAIFIFGIKIYVLGGRLSGSLFDRATGLIECYDIETKIWSTEKSYPQDVWEHSAVSLFIPNFKSDDVDILPISKIS